MALISIFLVTSDVEHAFLLVICICSRGELFFAHFFKAKVVGLVVVVRLFAFAYLIG